MGIAYPMHNMSTHCPLLPAPLYNIKNNKKLHLFCRNLYINNPDNLL